jgi:hypothetical protein
MEMSTKRAENFTKKGASTAPAAACHSRKIEVVHQHRAVQSRIDLRFERLDGKPGCVADSVRTGVVKLL